MCTLYAPRAQQPKTCRGRSGLIINAGLGPSHTSIIVSMQRTEVGVDNLLILNTAVPLTGRNRLEVFFPTAHNPAKSGRGIMSHKLLLAPGTRFLLFHRFVQGRICLVSLVSDKMARLISLRVSFFYKFNVVNLELYYSLQSSRNIKYAITHCINIRLADRRPNEPLHTTHARSLAYSTLIGRQLYSSTSFNCLPPFRPARRSLLLFRTSYNR